VGSEAVASILETLGYTVSGFLLQGALTALEISVIAIAAGVVLGLGLAMMRLSTFKPVSALAWFYIWFMRGTPVLLQLVFLYDALPPLGLKLDSFTTAVVGFSLNEAAFCAEIIRGGIISVDRRQTVAAAALGMARFLTLRRIILPQAMRAILPALANQSISVIKGTAVASVIFVNELTFRSQQIVGQNFKFFTVFAAAGLIYLVMTSAVAGLQRYLEQRFNPEIERRKVATVVPDEEPEAMDWRTLIEAAPSATSDAAFVTCRGVRKAYGSREILRGIDLSVGRGEVVVVMGPSGSGKSTLLRLINHLEHLDGGEIIVDGRHVGYESHTDGRLEPVRDLAKARAEARIGMVFQSFNLFEHLSALENVMEAPVQVYGRGEAETRSRGVRLLSAVGLGGHVDHLPHRLSGGQQQRVAIARALAVSPKLMLFDEPTSALDPELVGEVLTAIRHMAEAGMTMIVVTHEVRFAREVADRIVFMDEGLIVEQGTPEEVLDRPTQERTQRFLRLIERPARQASL
jgi:polar amino acid transport system ATP-binding protein/polar amino acid transport system permease protein